MTTYNCETCGEEYEANPSNKRRFCSSECYHKWRWENYKSKDKEKGNCLNCGKEFVKLPNRMMFCNKECYLIYKKSHKKDRSTVCKNCGGIFQRKYNSAGKFCCFKCAMEYRRAHRIKRIRVCKYCGKEFEFKKYSDGKSGHRYGIYCSKACGWAGHRKKPKMPTEIATCQNCGEEFEKSELRKKYCSIKCYREDRSKNRTGNPRSCRTILKEHHEKMKEDPERLTTSFIAKMVGCACPKIEKPKVLKITGGVA